MSNLSYSAYGAPDLLSVWTPDGRTIWAAGELGLVIRSMDAGVTWTALPAGTGHTLYSIFGQIGGTRLWAVGKEGTALYSGDGGQSWYAQPAYVEMFLASVQGRPRTTFFSIHGTPDGAQIWIVGDYYVTLKSTDGGASWAFQRQELLGAWQPGWSSVATRGLQPAVRTSQDGNHVWILGEQASGAGRPDVQSGVRVSHSGDGGASWEDRTTPARSPLEGLHCSPDGTRAWAVGEGGVIVHSADAGRTWEALPSPTRANLHAITGPRSQRGVGSPFTLWAVGDGGLLLRSRDGGATWQTQIVATKRLNDIGSDPDGVRLWGVGDDATIVASADGGESWTVQAAGSPKPLKAPFQPAGKYTPKPALMYSPAAFSKSWPAKPAAAPLVDWGTGTGYLAAIAPSPPLGSYEHGTLGQFVAFLQAAGIAPEAALAFLQSLDLTDLANVLEYLKVAVLDGSFNPQRLLFHLELIKLIPPAQYSHWRKLLQDIRYKSRLSAGNSAFVRDEGIEEHLHDLLLEQLGLEKAAPREPRVRQMAYLRSMLAFFENWESLVTADPNVPLLIQTVNRYGSIQQYYAAHATPRRTVQRMVECGYNAAYFVFGRQEIVSLGPSAAEPGETWATRLASIVKRVLGSRDQDPELDLAIDRHKFFHEIKDDYTEVKQHADRAAGLRLISRLLPALAHRQEALLRNGDVVAEARLQQCAMEIVSLRSQLSAADHLQPQRLVAVRSPKLVPELLFDNTRLACCLFKPHGLFHGEICRLILDPATPLIEFWLEPYPEFLGLATLYAGVNGQGERTILMDSIDYNDQLHDLRGYNGTMRFMLDALAIDACLAGAEKLVVFAAPWGKPLNFANFCKQMESRFDSIRYHESYYFEAVDPADQALGHSLAGEHHYTEAFGYLRPLAGVIDYGFNLVTLNSVEKLLTAGRGVFEIDVAAFVRENDLLGPAVRQSMPAPEVEAAIHAKPAWQREEICAREQEVSEVALAAVKKNMFSAPRLEFVQTAGEPLLEELVAAEREAFAEDLRYSAAELRERLQQRSSELLLLRDGNHLIGFALYYVIPAISSQYLFLDDLLVIPRYQSKKVGSTIVAALTGLAGVRGYRGIYVSTEQSEALTAFYRRMNFQFAGAYADLGQLLYRPLSLTGPENALRVEKITTAVEQRLRRNMISPKVSVHNQLDPELLHLLGGLEAGFPDDMRYNPSMFYSRMGCPDAYVLLVTEQNEPAAYCLSFQDPSLPAHAISLDSLSVKREFRKLGLSPVVIETAFALPTLTQYTTGVFYCQRKNQDGVDLVRYYGRFGARVVDEKNGRVRMVVDLRTDRRAKAMGLRVEQVSAAGATGGNGRAAVRADQRAPANGRRRPIAPAAAENGSAQPVPTVEEE
ncbi:MAG: GNAT family N-acetyltransferase [Acidobacteria bacterium]|nr:GNAT family N-acetyltransferase [Acidobacteriota bacterium]